MKKSKSNKKIDFHYRKVFVVILIFVLIYYSFLYLTKPDWGVSNEGILYYSAPRSIDNERVLLNETATEKVYKVIFESRGARIYGILRIPKTDKKTPAVVVLPGAGVSKESETKIPEAISTMGYATLTIDQRDTGETRRNNPEGFDTRNDLERFKNKTEAVSYKMIFDAVNAYHLMKQFDEVDPSKITLVGISNGGRIAIIAAAIDPEINNVIGISTAGFNIPTGIETAEAKFLRSIDPDTYVAMVSPGKVVMMHSKSDPVIPFELAWNTFSKAKEPKEFVSVTCETHGYCDQMQPYLEKELRGFFGK